MEENPRGYPDIITSVETGRPLYRGIKKQVMVIGGESFTYDQPGWWASLDDPDDNEGQLIDDDNLVITEVRQALRNRYG